MQNDMEEKVKGMQAYLKWVGENHPLWKNTWDGSFSSESLWTQIEIIEELQKGGLYSDILNLLLNFHNDMEYYVIQSVIEEIIETWGKDEWDEIIKKITDKLKQWQQEKLDKEKEISKSQI